MPGTELGKLPVSLSGQVAELARRCEHTPGCAAFQTDGVIKLDVNTTGLMPDLMPPADQEAPECWGTYVAQADPLGRWMGLVTDLDQAIASAQRTAQQYAEFDKVLQTQAQQGQKLQVQRLQREEASAAGQRVDAANTSSPAKSPTASQV